MTDRRPRPEAVPRSARFTSSGRNDVCTWGTFTWADGRADVCWGLDGHVWSERYFDGRGRRSGLEVERFPDGRISWCVRWVRGQMHGVAMQFDEEGRVLARSRFVRGSGVDVFTNCGKLTEFHELVNSAPHGFTRWGNPLRPWAEEHYLAGKRSGVFRSWDGASLQPGFPRYFVDDEEVTRAAYRRIRSTRRELPADLRREDSPTRTLPASVARVWLRRRGLRFNAGA